MLGSPPRSILLLFLRPMGEPCSYRANLSEASSPPDIGREEGGRTHGMEEEALDVRSGQTIYADIDTYERVVGGLAPAFGWSFEKKNIAPS